MTTYRDYRPDRRFQQTVAVSPDGASVAYSDNLSGQYNLVVTLSAGGPERRLTDYADKSVRDVRWTPDGASLIFAADANGDEFFQVYRIAAGGGDPEQFTDRPDVQYVLGDVSPDGRLFAYAGNDRELRDQDILVRDLGSGDVRRPYADGGAAFPGAWSPDGSRLLGTRFLGQTETEIYLLDPDGKPAEKLMPAGGEDPVYAVPGPWLPDGSGFLVRTDRGRDFVGLARFDLATRALTWLVTPDWDVEDAHLSHDGQVVVYSVNNNGVSQVHATQFGNVHSGGATGALSTPGMPAGTITALSVDDRGTTAAALIATGSRPTNVVMINLGTGETRWLTDAAPDIATTSGKTGASAGLEPTLVHYPTFDGKLIPAWLYRPTGDGPFAVVISIHGGPEAQERPSYNYGGLYQYLVANRIAVLAPNVRGSNGYGRAYQRLVLRDWGGDDLRDFEAAAQYLRDQDWADPARIGVFGGSYGGFATLSCLSRLPGYFACGVDVVGPSNLVTLGKSAPPTWHEMIATTIGDPDTEADFLLSRSPITYADQIVAPLFVIQGANDPRVHQAESDGIVEALRNRGVDVKYDVYSDEGHGFTRKENEAKAMGDSADFLIRHLSS
jgi:dipeptidyl aminopeptidase/acylaminoacyl peptidase